jgi:hypothetical protein
MKFKDYKYEIIIGSGMAFVFASLFLNILNWTPKKTGILSNVSFEMVRPVSEFRNEYSLNDREIDKEFVNPFKKKEATKAQEAKANKPKLVPVKNQVAKKDQTNSKKDIKKKGMDVTIVPRSQNLGLTPSDSDQYNNNYNQNPNNVTANPNVNKKQNVKTPNDEDVKVKTAADFSDLATNPTAEKVKEIILAYKNGEISSGEFYQVVTAMVHSENPNAQSMGVYLCYNFPSVESFSIVAINLDKFNAQVKTYADEFLLSFNHQARLQYLGQALQSNDIKIVTKAGEVIILGLQKVKNGQNINYAGRDGRGNNDINSTKFFEFLLPIAEVLKKSSDQTVASVGVSISQEIGPTTAN